LVQEATQQEYYYGTGKRKTAIARVRLYQSLGPGQAGQIQINGKSLEAYFPWAPWQATVREALEATDSMSRFSVVVRVQGGGVMAQSEAIRHGISRALVVYDETFKPALRRRGFLTRDSRIKESKKYGLKRARRAPQYTKR
jgi:small subunit ribosomal protein S9